MAKLTNDLKDLRGKKIADLENLVLEIRETQFKNRMKHKTGQLNESHLLTADRKKIAQIKTVINEKKSEEESACGFFLRFLFIDNSFYLSNLFSISS